MKKVFCFALVALLVVGTVGCGGETGSGKNEMSSNSTNGTVTISLSGKNIDGFDISTGMTVWEPIEFKGRVGHPMGSDKIMDTLREGSIRDGSGRRVWLIPFAFSITNESIGCGSIDEWATITLQGYYYDYPEGEGRGAAPGQRVGLRYPVEDIEGNIFGSNSVEIIRMWIGGVKRGQFEWMRTEQTIKEGASLTILGYVVLCEPEKTSADPDGFTKEILENYQLTLSYGTSMMVAIDWRYQPVVTLTMNDAGELILGERHPAVW